MAQLSSRYKQMFVKMVDGAFFQRADGALVDVNPAALELFGLTLDQFTGRTSYHPDWRVTDESGNPLPPEQHPSMVALRTGSPVTNFIARVHNPLRQDTVWLEINATPLFNDGESAPSEVFVTLRNISARKKTEESLLTSEEKFARIFNLSPALMSISTIDTGCYLEVNDSFCRISGFARQEVIGKTSVELGWIQAAKREEMKEALRRDGKISDVELELARCDGSVITVLYTAAIITISGQERLLSIALDITGRKRNLARLDYLSECFKQALNGSRHILYRLDVKKGGYDYLSPAAEMIHGIPYADSLGYNLEQVFDHIHPDDRIRLAALLAEAIQTRTANSIDLELEYRIRKTDGHYTWLLDSTRLVVDESGEMQYFFGSAYDINPLKEIEQLLRASEERYRAIVNTQNEFIDRFLPGGILTFVNDALCRFTGAEPADLIGKSFYPFIHEDDRQKVIATIDNCSLECSSSEIESRVVLPDGSVHWHFWSHTAIFDEDGNVIEYQSVGRDITRQKLAELANKDYEEKLKLALTTANDKIRQMNFMLLKIEEQERMRIAAELHDQVGQSLLLAKMKVDALVSETGADEKDVNSTQISRLLENCIQDIRTLTFTLRPPLLDTAGIGSALEWLCKSLYENYHIQVNFSNSCQAIHLNSEGRYSLYQAVRELLLNVAKHSGVDQAELSLKSVGSELIIKVSDKGSGFAAESESCESVAGTGFGLFNVSQRIKMLGGYCQVESQPGKGTIITLTLPVGE